jgi:streptogramin lyase
LLRVHIASVAFALLAVTCLVAFPTMTAMAGGLSSTVDPDQAQGSILDMIHLPGPVYSLAYDGPRNSLWYADMTPGEEDALYEYHVGTGEVTRWELPSTDHNGYMDPVVVAPDGTIWLTEDYTVVRFSPTTGAIQSRRLDINDPDAKASALSRDDMSPGTWPSAISFDSQGRALVARHNVNAIIVLDATLSEVARVRIPAMTHGPGDLIDNNGALYLTAYLGDGPSYVLNEQGTPLRTLPAGLGRLSARGHEVVGVGPGGSVELSQQTGQRASTMANEGTTDDLVAATDSGSVAYLRGPGVIERFLGGTSVARFGLTGQAMTIRGPGGAAVNVNMSNDVTALAVDGNNSVWFIDRFGGSTSLTHIAL